jgi:hypothetical protein
LRGRQALRGRVQGFAVGAAQVERQVVGSDTEIAPRRSGQGLAPGDVLAVLREEDRRASTAVHLALEPLLTLQGDAQQVVVHGELLSRRHPAPVGIQGALLHTDPRQEDIEIRLLQGQARVDLAEATLVDVAVAQQAEQHAELRRTALVGVVAVLVDREVTARERIVAVEFRAQGPQGLDHLAAEGRAVVEAGGAIETVGAEHEVEGAERLGHLALGGAALRQGLEDGGKMPARGGQDFLRQQRRRRRWYAVENRLGTRAESQQQAEYRRQGAHQLVRSPGTIPSSGKSGGKLFIWRQIS